MQYSKLAADPRDLHGLAAGSLRTRRGGTYNPDPLDVAHWCSRLTRCPLKAETTGSSPVCATNNINEGRLRLTRAAFRFATRTGTKISTA